LLHLLISGVKMVSLLITSSAFLLTIFSANAQNCQKQEVSYDCILKNCQIEGLFEDLCLCRKDFTITGGDEFKTNEEGEMLTTVTVTYWSMPSVIPTELPTELSTEHPTQFPTRNPTRKEYEMLDIERRVAIDEGNAVEYNGRLSNTLSMDSCEDACTESERCHSFSYCPGNGCWLKDKILQKGDAVRWWHGCTSYREL